MIGSRLVRIFHKGSRTYFYSSLFFGGAVKRDVFTLYAFVRTADDFVDQVPQDGAGFEAFVARYRAALAGRRETRSSTVSSSWPAARGSTRPGPRVSWMPRGRTARRAPTGASRR